MNKQIGGDHYAKKTIQPWDIIDEYGLDFYAGNVIKYVLRYKDKNGEQDLKKAIHYLEKLIDKEYHSIPSLDRNDIGDENHGAPISLYKGKPITECDNWACEMPKERPTK